MIASLEPVSRGWLRAFRRISARPLSRAAAEHTQTSANTQVDRVAVEGSSSATQELRDQIRAMWMARAEGLGARLVHMGDKVLAPTISPTLGFVDCERAVTWLQEVLGFEVSALFREDDGSIVHAQLVWRDGAINVYQATTPRLGPASISLTVASREEVDRMAGRATAAGTELTMPVEESFTGHYRFQVRDPESNYWNVGDAWINSDKALALPQRVI